MNMSKIILLEEKVRLGREPDNPKLLQSLLTLLEDVDTNYSKHYLKSLNLRVLDLLLDAAADESVPENWRHLCMDHVFKPLRNLYRLAKDDGDLSEINKISFTLSKKRALPE
tara:strand:+ start:214 stop:549 length:336 start_codon:yes stop_codon:yes gene_type:complete